MDVKDAIRTKRAVRKFSQLPVPRQSIIEILNAGRRSQSSKNNQDWQFIAITDDAILGTLAKCGEYAGHLGGAAFAVAILTPDPAEKFQYLFDAGQAAAFMQLAAWELGIGSCPASIYQPEMARAILGFPLEWHLRIALSFGYPVNEKLLTSPPRSGGRKQLSELVHWEKWDNK
jgi:nitroreductase